MQLKCDIQWISRCVKLSGAKETATIISAALAKNKWDKDELILTVRLFGEEFQWSVFGKCKNALIAKFGNETDKWIGQSFAIYKESNVDGKSIVCVA